jgi:hypothetical protein
MAETPAGRCQGCKGAEKVVPTTIGAAGGHYERAIVNSREFGRCVVQRACLAHLRTHWAAVWVAILLGIGCGKSPGQTDSGPGIDGYGELVVGVDSGADVGDASPPDAVSLDGGGAIDRDAELTDAGDSGVGDASQPDARPPNGDTDGGRPDANPFVCDPVAQTGCETGQKCDLAESRTFACVPSGTLREFQHCEPVQPNACQAGYTCQETDWGDNRCARLCDPKSDDCLVGESCDYKSSTRDGNSYWMCQTPHECAPLQQDCQSTSNTCYFVVGAGAFCLQTKATTVSDGSKCIVPQDCARGSTCLEFHGGYRCYRMCAPARAEQECGAGVVCTVLGNVGPEEVGACGY